MSQPIPVPPRRSALAWLLWPLALPLWLLSLVFAVTGTVRQPKGRSSWRAQFQLPTGPDGKKRFVSKNFPTKEEAQAWLRKQLVDRDEGRFVEPSKLTVGALLDEWLDVVRPRLGPSTFAGYHRIVEGHLKPLLGTVAVQKLTPGAVSRAYGAMRRPGAHRGGNGRVARPLSETSILRAHGVLTTSLKWAVGQGYVARNVCDVVVKPRAARREWPCWTAEELKRFLFEIEGDRLYPFIRLAAMTGMRRSELLGLTWPDVDLDLGRLSVRRRRIRVGYEMIAQAGGKTRGAVRVVDLDERTCAVLRAWRKAQMEERLFAGSAWEETGLVFTAPAGCGVHADHVADGFERLVAASSVPRIRFHDLRHTHASLMIQAGVPVKVVSERLGHANPAFTLAVYQHVLPGMQSAAVAKFSSLID